MGEESSEYVKAEYGVEKRKQLHLVLQLLLLCLSKLFVKIYSG